MTPPMTPQELLSLIAEGRTDLVHELLALPDWRARLVEGAVKPMQWFVYFDDVTALRCVLQAGGDLSSLDLDAELGNAAFFGHWKVADFLIAHGADPRFAQPDTGETALHSALSKAGRPSYVHVVRLLLEKGADVHARTRPGVETAAFMRDVRTKGETPLHRAAAFASAEMITLLLEHGADREATDAAGDTPLSWASWHLRPASVLALLSYGPHRISPAAEARHTSDHGSGWGSGMDWNLFGTYRPVYTRGR